MFDNLIYKILDKVHSFCERYKEYIKEKKLPKEDKRKQDTPQKSGVK